MHFGLRGGGVLSGLAAAFFLFISLSPGFGIQSGASTGNSSAPVVFAPGVVSTGSEFGLTFTPNGSEAYFTRFNAEKRTNHICDSPAISRFEFLKTSLFR
ncbi:MAG: hypothetical protein DMF61_08385 [Blastocatellia bacterium AA13]|nr:MAG: hypothetical protein DMF61_08385 [Blastocatellia bacterium AA13]